MKVSEITNEELARNIETMFDSEILREAAARLRRPTAVDDDLLKMAGDIDKLRAENAELQRRLKVAEDALEFSAGCITRDCYNDCDHHAECRKSGPGHLCSRKINDALAAIREEKGESE